jgi:hypothetical protein
MPNPSDPLVTFIVPAFNAAGTLSDTLASLQAQTTPRWSAIVVDDGSTDGTAQVARGAGDARIGVISQENRGLAGARNTGLKHTPPGAAFVSFLDADDTIAPEFCEVMLAAIGDHDALACAYELTGPDHEPLGWTTRPAAHDVTIGRLIETNPFAVTGMYRLESLRRLGTLPSPPARQGDIFDESLRVLEDWDLWLRAGAAGLRWAMPVDQALFRYRLMPGLSRNVETMWTTGLKVITRAPAPARLKPRALRRWTLRNAARAIANCDGPLAVLMLSTLTEIKSDDLTTLAAALAPAFQRAEVVGPAHAGLNHARWRHQIESALSGLPWCTGLLTRFDSITTDWAALARHIAVQLRPGDIPTVYGMGWNGQGLIAELAAALPGTYIAWLDDAPAAAAPTSIRSHRIDAGELTARHALIVTPNDPAPMLAKLAGKRLRVLWPREQHARAA